MKLRRSFSSHQLLFAFGVAAFLACSTLSQAQDKIIDSTGQAQDVKIVGVRGSSIIIATPNGEVGQPLSGVRSVVKAAPPEVAAAEAAFAAKDYAKALAQAKVVADKFTGLPVDWARQMSAMVGNCYVELGKFSEAEAAYNAYAKAYGSAGSQQADVGLARIAISKKDYAGAKQKLTPFAEKALATKAPTDSEKGLYGQVFLLLGQIDEAEQNFPSALENYLRTVTLYYTDASAVAAAKEKAAELRKNQKVTVP